MTRLRLVVTVVLASACGPSLADLEQRDGRIAEARADADGQRERADALEDERDDERARANNLVQILDGLGGPVERLERDREAMRRELEEAQRAIEALEAARAAADSQLRSARREGGAARADLAAARRALEQVRLREQQARARLETFRSLLEQFRAMIDAGQLRVRVVRNRMVIELPEAVLFDSGRDRIKPDGASVLEQVARVLATIERDFQVAGHTDNVPIRTARFPSNWELSTARAVNVARFLMERGVTPARLSAAGYADTQPVAPNTNDEGRAQNRRIEIAIVPNLDELPDLSALDSQGAPR